MKKRLMAAFLVGCLLLSLCGCNVVINVREQSDEGSTDETVTTTEEAESYVIDDGVPWIDSNLKENAVNSAKPSVKDDFNLAVNYDWMCSTDIPEGYVGYSTLTRIGEIVEEKAIATLEDDSIEGHDAELARG